MVTRSDMAAEFFSPPDIAVERRPDGTIILASRDPLGGYPDCIGQYLVAWAANAPDRTYLAQRAADGQWRRLTYAQALDRVTRLAAALLARGLGPDRPVAVLSGNSLGHALVSLAAQHVGIPVAPLSPAYSLLSKDFAKLKYVLSVVGPGMIYVDDSGPFEAALGALDIAGVHLLCERASGGRFEFERLETVMNETACRDLVAPAFARLTPDTVAKILFTSGSTGDPKGVINSQRMLCSNQQAMAQCWPFLGRRPPVLVDWLPWSHTFGANHNFNLVLRHGGTLYIDGGKPAPGAIEATVANLKSVSPTVYFNVPAGYEALLPHLEEDAELARHFFADLDLLFYGAAALPRNSWRRLEAVAAKATRHKPPFSAGWGSTETGPLATTVHYPIAAPGPIGLPVPGTALKLTPHGDSFEMRVKGPNVTPGYWRDPKASAQAFDAQGFYRMGDAGRFEDPDDPVAGVLFDGRIGENFKLRSGTWVNVGALRVRLIGAAKPVIRDAVICGEGEKYLALLIFPDAIACRRLAGAREPATPLRQVIAHPRVRQRLRAGLAAHNAEFPAGSTRIRRALIMTEPADIDAGETTDKGYINQRGVLRRRADLVARLYRGGAGVIEIDG